MKPLSEATGRRNQDAVCSSEAPIQVALAAEHAFGHQHPLRTVEVIARVKGYGYVRPLQQYEATENVGVE